VTGVDPATLRAITFDFGNTLVPVHRAGLRRVVQETGLAVVEKLGPFDFETYLATWDEERERQFREEVPQFREVDLEQRFVRVLARLRGMASPPDEEPWDQDAAARLSTSHEVSWAVRVYSESFIRGLPPAPAAGRTLEALAPRFDLAILSNWPLAATIDRYVESAGWAPLLRAVVVSQRVGTIKPHPAIFEETRRLLGEPAPTAILHVGDDWAADVVGASRAGWRTAYIRARPTDSPLPSSARDGSVTPDLEIAAIDELVTLLGTPAER
jgi:FMN phosphatase YigB (HAD superfamily)